MVRANACEPSTTVVTVAKPKMLTGLHQKVRGRHRRSALACRRHLVTGGQTGPTPSGYGHGTW
jgi:hypothetical protein